MAPGALWCSSQSQSYTEGIALWPGFGRSWWCTQRAKHTKTYQNYIKLQNSPRVGHCSSHHGYPLVVKHGLLKNHPAIVRWFSQLETFKINLVPVSCPIKISGPWDFPWRVSHAPRHPRYPWHPRLPCQTCYRAGTAPNEGLPNSPRKPRVYRKVDGIIFMIFYLFIYSWYVHDIYI